MADLHASERRHAMVTTACIVVVEWVVLIGAYSVYPGRPGTAAGAILKTVLGVALVVGAVVVELKRIVGARLPQLRAVEALGVILPLFFVVFAAVYLSLGQGRDSMFSPHLDHARALYFVVTVFSTVGFGDIVPVTDTARLLVATQMLLDLTFVGAVVRALFTASERGLERTEAR